MDIEDWRRKIDELDRSLVALINQRAQCAIEIGKLKQQSAMPVYEPDREKIIYEHIVGNNAGPLTNMQLRQIYERMIDVMRQIQHEIMVPEADTGRQFTELEPND